MTKEELINELKELRNERIEDLMKLSVKHDSLSNYIAELNHLIYDAEKESNDDN